MGRSGALSEHGGLFGGCERRVPGHAWRREGITTVFINCAPLIHDPTTPSPSRQGGFGPRVRCAGTYQTLWLALRSIISVDERADIIEALDADAYKVSAGGSLSNSLVALSRLGAAAERQSLQPAALRVAMAGVVGGDPLSHFYSAQLRDAGVSIISQPEPHSCTGTIRTTLERGHIWVQSEVCPLTIIKCCTQACRR